MWGMESKLSKLLYNTVSLLNLVKIIGFREKRMRIEFNEIKSEL